MALSTLEAKVITATHEQVAVIRRGWLSTAAAVAPEVDGLTDFVEDQLVDLESRGELTENDLLAIVEAASQMVLASGGADQARDTSRRMRRTVYEFLLALDASSGDEESAAPGGDDDQDGGSGRDGPPAATGPLLLGDGPTMTGTAALEAHADPDPDPDDSEQEVAWEGVGRRRPVPPASDANGAREEDGGEWAPVSRTGFHLTDPVELLADGVEVEPAAPVTGPEAVEPTPPAGDGHVAEPAPSEDDVAGPTPPAGDDDVAEPGTTDHQQSSHLPAASADEGPSTVSAEPAQPAEPTAGGAPKLADDGEFEEWVSTAPPSSRPLPAQTPAAWTAKVAEATSAAPWRYEPSLVPDVWADDAAREEPADADGREPRIDHEPATPPDGDPPANTSNWRVRKPELVGEGGRRGSSRDLPDDSWQSAADQVEPEPDLRAPRQEIHELLRRKRFDQAGAVLQQLARDRGGRAVAELALDTGDRCRGTGKRMAATSCYLAASRADPVFEEPLGRLADVCIDDRDIDLAVSYLERIARLTRARGDIKGALRTYRRIHAIAPYRDDILDLLMRAQTTGRLDP